MAGPDGSILVIELLDPTAGVALQSWTIADVDCAQIGRAEECDVVIGSPFVSRCHACVRLIEHKWHVSCVSQHGMFVDGARSEMREVVDGLEIRLSGKGPSLRFRLREAEPTPKAFETISFDPEQMPLLTLNVEQRDREVAELTHGDYFAELRRKARALREQRQGSPGGNDPG